MEVLNPYAFLKNEGTGFCWFGEIDVTADELMSGVNDIKDESKKSVAMTMIRRMLETGPILYENILQESEDKIDYFLQIEKSRIA